MRRKRRSGRFRGPERAARLEFLYFLIRRVLWSLLVLFGLSIVIFVIARVMPGDPARMALGPRASQEQVAGSQGKMGLDKPAAGAIRANFIGRARRTAISACPF